MTHPEGATLGRRLAAITIDWLASYAIAFSFFAGGGSYSERIEGTRFVTPLIFVAEYAILIVLTGEGSNSVRQLLQDEKRKTERYAPGVPIYELIVGDQEGQVALRKLQKRMKKFPKKLTANQMREVRARLKAVGGMAMPIPKGPMPTRGMKIR